MTVEDVPVITELWGIHAPMNKQVALREKAAGVEMTGRGNDAWLRDDLKFLSSKAP